MNKLCKLVEQSWGCCFPVAAGQHFTGDMVKEGNSHAFGRAEDLPIKLLPVLSFIISGSLRSGFISTCITVLGK